MVDANVALRVCVEERGIERLGRQPLAAPPLMWSEARSTLHLGMVKGELSPERARSLHERVEASPIERRDPATLGAEAWAIADELGWGRTYDAEYLALARLLGCKLVTQDGRLLRGAGRLGLVLALDEASSP